MAVVDEPSKLNSCNDSEEPEEQVKDHLVANEKAIEIPTENDIRLERSSKDRRYLKRERRSPGEWWKNYILPQHSKEWADVAFLDDPLIYAKH